MVGILEKDFDSCAEDTRCKAECFSPVHPMVNGYLGKTLCKVKEGKELAISYPRMASLHSIIHSSIQSFIYSYRNTQVNKINN